MKKVGSLWFNLERNDKQITTEPGDIILYQGNQFVIYYDTNSWNFTKLGHIDNINQEELKQILGKDNVTVILSLERKWCFMEKQTAGRENNEKHGGIFGMGEPNVNFAKYFIGNSYLKTLAKTENIFIANVTFKPGCRNNWHIHKSDKNGGQILICVEGEGWYQE